MRRPIALRGNTDHLQPHMLGSVGIRHLEGTDGSPVNDIRMLLAEGLSSDPKLTSPGTCRLFLFVFLLLCCVLGWFLFCVCSSCFARKQSPGAGKALENMPSKSTMNCRGSRRGWKPWRTCLWWKSTINCRSNPQGLEALENML